MDTHERQDRRETEQRRRETGQNRGDGEGKIEKGKMDIIRDNFLFLFPNHDKLRKHIETANHFQLINKFHHQCTK